jgi:plasmid maintenance system killer protein
MITDMQAVALRKLRLLNNAGRLDDLRVPPGNRLEALQGRRRGQHSIRINDQWRILLYLERWPCARSRNRRLPLIFSTIRIPAKSCWKNF